MLSYSRRFKPSPLTSCRSCLARESGRARFHAVKPRAKTASKRFRVSVDGVSGASRRDRRKGGRTETARKREGECNSRVTTVDVLNVLHKHLNPKHNSDLLRFHLCGSSGRDEGVPPERQ